MKIGLIGAGGKMGGRLTNNFLKTDYDVLYCEKSEKGIAELEGKGLTVTPIEDTAAKADIVILAVPDVLIFRVSQIVVPVMKAGAVLLTLDPAAACAEQILIRDDVTYVVTHPCHPALFDPQDSDEARADRFGGIAAKQDIVIAKLKGDDALFEQAEKVCIAMFAPVKKCHRITVEQMALLEPAAAEVVIAAAAKLMKEAMDEVVKRGVPEEAARSFLLGHVQIPLAIAFGAIDSPFSDGAKVAISVGNEAVFKDDWKKVFEPEFVKSTINRMLKG